MVLFSSTKVGLLRFLNPNAMWYEKEKEREIFKKVKEKGQV
jgi:hypothetical protein